jgi:pSer/pThr/pTyr-binding forkhead associated (FHA) protein
MICACCHRDNPPGHAFCHGCGAVIDPRSGRPTQAVFAGVVVCPSCGVNNAPGLQYCRSCGLALPSDTGGQIANVGPPVRVSSIMLAPCGQCGAAGEHNAKFCKFCGGEYSAGRKAAITGAGTVPPTAAGGAPAQLVILQRDGSDGGVFPISGDRVDIGGREGDIVLRDDPYLSPRHARIELRNDSFVLLDLGSTNGIYVRLREPETLADGDMILIGQQVLRFEISSEAERQVGPATQHGVMVFGTPDQPRLGRLTQYTTEGLARDVYYLHRQETVLGRESADLTFSDDPFLSRRHAAVVLHPADRRFVLRDLGSSNGTALRCRAERVLSAGDQFRLGRHLFRFDLVPNGREGQSRS